MNTQFKGSYFIAICEKFVCVMSTQSNRVVDGLIPGYGKIRKRGCSSSPSSSSKVHNYRFKRAIMVGKSRVGGGSRSSTPAPSWRMTPSSKSKLGGGGGVESPNYDGGGGRSKPVSARKLAATLWEMNEMPSPQNLETTRRRREKETTRVREKTNRPVHTPGSLPPHLSDPSHSPVSEVSFISNFIIWVDFDLNFLFLITQIRRFYELSFSEQRNRD